MQNFTVTVRFLAELAGGSFEESEDTLTARVYLKDGRSAQFARGSIGCMITNPGTKAGTTMRQMYCEALHRNGELLVSVEWFCRYLLNLQVSTCGGVVYVTDHFAELSCFMADLIRDIFAGSVMPRDYSFDEARIVLREMVLHGCHELMRRRVITKKVWIGVGYSKERLPMAHGQVQLQSALNVSSVMQPELLELYDSITDRHTPIRRLAINFCDVCSEDCQGYDFFTDWDAVERERRREQAVLDLGEKYGRNAVLRGTSLLDSATQKERNAMIGGHRAGYDEAGESETIHAL